MRNTHDRQIFRPFAQVALIACVGSAAAAPGDPWHRMEYCGSDGVSYFHFGTGDCASATNTATGLGYDVKGCTDFTENGVGPGQGNYLDALAEPELPFSGPFVVIGRPGQGVVVGYDFVNGITAAKGEPGSLEIARLTPRNAPAQPTEYVGIMLARAGQEVPAFRGEFVTNIQGDFEILYYTQSAIGPQLNREAYVIADLPFAPATIPCSVADLGEPRGALDIADVVAFLQAFGEGSPVADVAAPYGTFDIADVVAFLQVFGEGCP